jgi:hypothetical protein
MTYYWNSCSRSSKAKSFGRINGYFDVVVTRIKLWSLVFENSPFWCFSNRLRLIGWLAIWPWFLKSQSSSLEDFGARNHFWGESILSREFVFVWLGFLRGKVFGCGISASFGLLPSFILWIAWFCLKNLGCGASKKPFRGQLGSDSVSFRTHLLKAWCLRFLNTLWGC